MSDALAAAALSDAERDYLDRLLRLLCDRFGPGLAAVWLFGSRARGERLHDESDVDVLALVDDEAATRDAGLLIDLRWAAGGGRLGTRAAFTCDLKLVTPDWVEDRRRRRSLYMDEIDRDRLVLYERG